MSARPEARTVGPSGLRVPALLGDLPEEAVHRLVAAARKRAFAAGEVIFHAGDPADTLHLIVKGRVAAIISSRYGQQLTFALMGEGEFFGELALLGPDTVRTATVRALEPTETRSIRHTDFVAIRRDHPRVNEVLIRLLAARVVRLSIRLEEALHLPVETRVRKCLIEMAQIYGGGAPDTVIPLTQEELAALAGTARATVNRVLRQEEKHGNVSLGRHRVTVRNLRAVIMRAEIG
jgi:CRP-like cAMP-binding protein